MSEDIPVKEEANQDVKHNHNSCIECQGDPSIESADFGKRNAIDIVTLNGTFFATLRNLNNRVYPGKHHDNKQSKEHEFDEAEVESDWLVHTRNLPIICFFVCERSFERLVATGTMLGGLCGVEAKGCGLLMDHAHLEVGRNSESFEFGVLNGDTCVLVSGTLVDGLWTAKQLFADHTALIIQPFLLHITCYNSKSIDKEFQPSKSNRMHPNPQILRIT
jgi:hypothetical protein